MEVVDANAAWLSNFEVLEHLKSQKKERERISNIIGRPVRCAENVLTVEFETLSYLDKDQVCSSLSAEKIDSLLSFLKPFKLTKAEKLQIINLLPTTEVEFYLIVEECEERFTSEQINQALDTITLLIKA